MRRLGTLFSQSPDPHTGAEIEAAGGGETQLYAKPIWWQGKEYKAWPTKVDGEEMTSDYRRCYCRDAYTTSA